MELFMDLAAAAAFVAEIAEADVMTHPPRNPQAAFMDRGMVISILYSAAGLFTAVSTAYLIIWYRSHDLVAAQTVAFVAWLIGHVFLAINLRSERQPLYQLGYFTNKIMIGWGIAALFFIILITSFPGLQIILQTTSLNINYWVLIITLTIIGTFWIEIKKTLTY
jgi:Ca2+-transporting ATPase